MTCDLAWLRAMQGVALALAALAAGQASAAPMASHDAAFFEKLLADRAYVYKKPFYRRGDIAGYVLRPGGKALICTYRGLGLRETQRANWRITSSTRHRAALALYYDRDDPRNSRFRMVPFYDGESGRLHLKIWHRGDLRWVDRFDGWVQESWPRFLADACPGLVKDLPAGMAINEKQTAKRLKELRGQDPEAPIRRGGVEAGAR